MKTLYRIQTYTGEGLWYRDDGIPGNLVTRAPDARCRDLPMSWDDDIAYKSWRSATETLDEMREWISREEIWQLSQLGLFLWAVDVADGGYRRTTEPYAHAVYLDDAVLTSRAMAWVELHPDYTRPATP